MGTIHSHAASDKPPLLAHHLDQLTQGSGIALEVIKARGYRSIPDPEACAVLKKEGFARNQAKNTPGLLIPILDCHGSPVLYQYRPDVPRMNKEGKPIKYETPWKAHMRLDFGPGPHDWVGDPAIPLWITEGLKKANALRTHGLHTIGLLGIWNWRGTIPDGSKVASQA